jgi:hypothetical protein
MKFPLGHSSLPNNDKKIFTQGARLICHLLSKRSAHFLNARELLDALPFQDSLQLLGHIKGAQA